MMKYTLIILLFISYIVRGQVVDTFVVRMQDGTGNSRDVKIPTVSNTATPDVGDSIMVLNTTTRRRALLSPTDLKSNLSINNVTNTSDANKPVSTAQQTALDLKANLASPTFSGTVSGIAKSMVGLGSVDNTSDAGKPVSTAQQTALDLKANIASPTFTGTVGGITASMIGLGNVTNTSDANKPVSTAQQTALDLKANLASPTFTGTVILPSTTSIGTVTNTEIGYVDGVTSAIQTQMDGKQPLNGNLTTIAGLTATTDNFMVAVASAWASRTPAQVKTTLALNNVENTAISTYAGSSNITTIGTIGTGTWQGAVINSTYGGTGINNGGRTLTQNTNSATIVFPAASTTHTFANNSSTVIGKLAQVDIAATASATSTATIFTPTVSGMYRLSIYMKITTTGTSPVAGPVTITYTEPDGSVAQSHVMALYNVSGAVVTTTVNNSTTTGTVNGSMIFNAKSGVAITYAIAVSGTFASGRYTAHITLEAL